MYHQGAASMARPAQPNERDLLRITQAKQKPIYILPENHLFTYVNTLKPNALLRKSIMAREEYDDVDGERWFAPAALNAGQEVKFVRIIHTVKFRIPGNAVLCHRPDIMSQGYWLQLIDYQPPTERYTWVDIKNVRHGFAAIPCDGYWVVSADVTSNLDLQSLGNEVVCLYSRERFREKISSNSAYIEAVNARLLNLEAQIETTRPVDHATLR